MLSRGDLPKNYSSTVQVYKGIREIFFLHRQPASLKHINTKNHIAASSIQKTNASQTQLPTSCTQLILVFSSSSLGHHTFCLGDRCTQPSPPRTIQTSRASSQHSILPLITPSLRPWAALAPVFQDLPPQLTHARLRATEG